MIKLKRVSATLLFLILFLAGIAQVTGTYPVYNQTTDEPAHLAAGLELLTTGKYTLEYLHPPLARAAGEA